MASKDYFSGHAKVYAAFRPTYPEELYQFIFQHLKQYHTAWDCATGNGQVARYLAGHFDKIYATDISAQQLDQAEKLANVSYSVSKAEQTSFADNQFDLITVGQALHWFQVNDFYKEVNRTLKPEGLIAVWGYALLTIAPEIDKLFMDFYNNKVGPYWDHARKLVENEYRDISFPFAEIASPRFQIKVSWSLEQFAGYLTSWSATQKFIHQHQYNPVDEFIPVVKQFWSEGEEKSVSFPVFLKLGRK
jgi:ubiquinone/menaquinone biosynthesis C-methylase UbiE